MADARDQMVDAVAKLTELTQNGRLKWAVEEGFEAPGAASPAYTAEYKRHSLRMQKRRVKEVGSFFGDSVVRDQYILEFVGTDGGSLWAFPETEATEDLFAAIQYQFAGVKGFLKDLFDDTSK